MSASSAELDAARLLLEKMGIQLADLLTTAPSRPPAPTFAEYVPQVSEAVSDGTRRVYGSYWNRIVNKWGQRRLDEPTPSEIEPPCSMPVSTCMRVRSPPGSLTPRGRPTSSRS